MTTQSNVARPIQAIDPVFPAVANATAPPTGMENPTDLIWNALDGTATESQIQSLEKSLRESQPVRDELKACAQLHTDLMTLLGETTRVNFSYPS